MGVISAPVRRVRGLRATWINVTVVITMMQRYGLIFAVCMWVYSSALAAADFHIGYQKSALNLLVLKSRGVLEKRLKPHGYTVKWVEFISGPPILEALNVGSVDLALTGDTPPIFAQAAGTALRYVGFEAAKPKSSAILLPPHSTIHTLKDLHGKRVAFAKGSSAHYLVVRALERAGLTVADITPVYLSPADARSAFERASIDAWAVWDPFYAAAERLSGARVLVDGEGLVHNESFYLASQNAVAQHSEAVDSVLTALGENDQFLRHHHAEVIRILVEQTGQDATLFETVLARRPGFIVKKLTAAVIGHQQDIAERFFQLGLLPTKLGVAAAVWQP